MAPLPIQFRSGGVNKIHIGSGSQSGRPRRAATSRHNFPNRSRGRFIGRADRAVEPPALPAYCDKYGRRGTIVALGRLTRRDAHSDEARCFSPICGGGPAPDSRV